MIQLPNVDLPTKTIGLIGEYQQEVDLAGNYERQVEVAKELFSARNKASNRVFKVVRQCLNKMCGGAGRCCYCELSQPDEIEHFLPKDLFPEKVFVWENYLYSCGTCNGPKSSQFAIFRGRSKKPIEIARKRNDPIVHPAAGDSVLIHPRIENPLDFMELDLIDTFQFVPIFDEGTREYERARYTIKVLRLNERDVLVSARRHAFVAFRAILKEYIDLKVQKAPCEDLIIRIKAITTSPHPVVWQEMKRQRNSFPELPSLFQLAPEAESW